MNWYLVVYEQAWNWKNDRLLCDTNKLYFDFNSEDSWGKGSVSNYTETNYYSRLRSITVQASNKIEAYNKVKNSFKDDSAIVHIEEL